MVPKAGLEPARLTPLPPQDSVSTNSTTWAKTLLKRQTISKQQMRISTTPRLHQPVILSLLATPEEQATHLQSRQTDLQERVWRRPR